MTPFAPFFLRLPHQAVVPLLLAAILVDAAANYLYFRAFETHTAATASALLALSPLFSLLLAPLLAAGEAGLGPWQAVGIVVMVAGAALVSWESGRRSSEDSRLARFGLVPLLAALLFGANAFLTKDLLLAGLTPFTFYYLRAGVIAAVLLAALRPALGGLTRATVATLTLRGGLVIAQWLLYLYGLAAGSAAVIKAAADSSPLFVALFAGVFLHERVGRAQAIGVTLLVGGLLLLAR
jgi:drug/metabolite transporter (DMT)-like permease